MASFAKKIEPFLRLRPVWSRAIEMSLGITDLKQMAESRVTMVRIPPKLQELQSLYSSSCKIIAFRELAILVKGSLVSFNLSVSYKAGTCMILTRILMAWPAKLLSQYSLSSKGMHLTRKSNWKFSRLYSAFENICRVRL